MVTIRTEMPFDIDAREDLLDRVWGPSRFQKTAERLREGREPSAGLSFVAEHDGDIVGTVRLWDICAGPGRPAVLLGPLAVDESPALPGDRRRADAPRVDGCTAAQASRRAAGRRRNLLLALRLLGRKDRRRCGYPARMSATGCSPAS